MFASVKSGGCLNVQWRAPYEGNAYPKVSS